MREPLRVLVLEDEWPARNYLVQLIEQTGLGHVVAAVPSPSLASEALAAVPVRVDLAFVDIHLAGESDPQQAGLSWIQTLAERRKGAQDVPRVVLTTASKEHAMRAFELGVVDYLLKPFTEQRVRESLTRVAEMARPQAAGRAWLDEDVRIAARKGRSIRFLERSQAFAFEAEGRLCYVHSSEGRLDVDLSLTSLEAVLGPAYLRVHRNWLVSMSSVRSMDRDGGDWVLMVGPSDPPLRVQVARDRAGAVRDRLLASAVGLRRDA
jgi:DNA-binding LytR/AlgR family response regulator